MKLHLPVKLRASLLAAIIAVPAVLYNAFAADYIAPSNDYRWDNNDIELEETYLATSGNTYTANAQTYDIYETYEDFDNVRVGYIVNPEFTGDTPTFPTDYIKLNYNGETYSYIDDSGAEVTVPMKNMQGDGTLVDNPDLHYHITSPDVVDAANIIIRNTENEGSTSKIVSYINGNTTLTAADNIEINNSLYSGNQTQEGSHPYEGDLNLNAKNLVITKDSQNQGSTVVLEDANVSIAEGTSIAESSNLVILDGDADYTDTEKNLLGIGGIVANPVDRTEKNTVALGAVTGAGSLAVVGNKEEGVEGDNLDLSIESIDLRKGTVGFADADADVQGDIAAKTLTLVSSDTTSAGKVTISGLNVDGESKLTAQGTVSNASGGGSGHVDVKGYVESVTGSVEFSNGMEEKNYGVKEGATVIAEQNIVLSNVDVNKAAKLEASTGDLRLSTNSSIEDTHDIYVGDDLSVAVGSEITDSTIGHVGGDVIITDYAGGEASASSSVVNTSITVNKDFDPDSVSNIEVSGGSNLTGSTITGADGTIAIERKSTVSGSTITMAPDATDGVEHAMTVSDSTIDNSTINNVDGSVSVTGSTLTNATVTIAPDDAVSSTVTLEGTTATNTHISGGTGDITVNNSTVTVADTDTTQPTTNFIGADKEGLADILAAAAGTTPLTSDSLGDSFTVGSSMENTSGAVTITDSSVNGTLITGGGDITIDDNVDTPDSTEAIAAVKDMIDEALANPDPETGAVTVPYTEINGEFGTVVDGSILDVRGAEDADGNDLTVSQAALTNSVVLGITGKIKVEDSVLGNDYIDGGSGLEIDNSVIVDTDIVNMNADIVLKGGVTMVSTDADKPFTLATKGTADITDADKYTGGSIILEGTDLTNGKIMSGVEVGADGTITYLEDTADNVGTSTTPGGAVSGELTDVKLPYGQISVKDSSLTNMELYTAKGDISVDASTVTDSGISAAGAGNISISNQSTIDNTSVITGGAGNITIADSTVTDTLLYDEDDAPHAQQIATGGAGNISIKNSTVYDTDVTTQGDGDITITDSSVAVAGPMMLDGSNADLRKKVSTGGAGNIKITGSSIAHIDVANSTAIADADKATLGVGTVTVTNSTVADSSVLTGTGDISVTDSAVSSSSVTSIGAGNITLKGTSATADYATDASYADGAGKDRGDYNTISLSSGLTAIGVPANAGILNSISIVEEAKKSTPSTTLTGVYCQLVKGGTVVATAGPVDLTGVQDATATFDFGGVAIDPTATDYVLKFVDENGATRNVRLVVNNSTGNPAPMGGGWDAIVKADYIAPSTQPTDANWTPSNTVADSAISTGAGNIAISTTKVTDSTVTNAGDGNITISNSAILGSETGDGSFTTAITTAGKGNIRVTDSVTDKATITTGEGNITLAGTLPITATDYSTTASYANKATSNTRGNYSSVTISKLSSIGVPTNATSISSMTFELGSAAQTGVQAVLKDAEGNVVATSSAISITERGNGEWPIGTFDFGGDVAVKPSAAYTVEFIDADGNPVKLNMNHAWLADSIASTTTKDGEVANAIISADYKSPVVDLDDMPAGSILTNVVSDSLIQSAGEGDITITRTDMDNSIVLTGSGDTAITASDIQDSLIDSTDAGRITIKGAHVEDSSVTSGEGTNDATITIANSDIIRTGVKAAAAGGNNTITGSYVEDSVVYSGGGNMTISQSEVVGSDVETANGGMFVRGESTIDSMGEGDSYDKSTLTATDDSKVFEGSTISGTNISISDTDNDGVAPDLTVEGTTADGLAPTTIAGDVNINVDGMLYISTDGKLALDGNRTENPTARDASITATSMLLGDIWEQQASIANAQVAITDKTLVRDGNTLTIDSVNSIEEEGVGTLGDLAQSYDDGGDTLVAISGASNLQVDSIGTVSGFSEALDVTAAVDDNMAVRPDQEAYYFDHITLDEDSKLEATGNAMIDTLDVNVPQNDTATIGSHATFRKDAHIINANIVGEDQLKYTYSTPADDTHKSGVTINGDAHIGNLSIKNEGVLNIAPGTENAEATESYIANIKDAHGALNLVNGTLTTPELNSDKLMLGLNGGTVVLAPVTDPKLGATETSDLAANAAVVLRGVTNASMAGGTDITPVGASTIKSTVSRVESLDSINPGVTTTTTATTYYYKVMSDTVATADVTVQRWNETAQALEDVTVAAGDTLLSGDIVTKTDKTLTTTTASDGSIVNTGIATSDAHLLTDAEESYLVRITVPVLDAEGKPTFTEIGEGEFVLNVGQTVTQTELTYQNGYQEIDGSVSVMTDGIASLTVERNFDADNTTIKAYQTGTLKYMLEGTELTQEQYEALSDEEKATVQVQVLADANTGFITIKENIYGQDNTFYADNNITIKGGIVANSDNNPSTTEAAYETNNTLTSEHGDIAVNGITASANNLTALEGQIVIGTVDENGNITSTSAITGNDNLLAAGTITTGSITGDHNGAMAVVDNMTVQGNVTGDGNILSAMQDVEITGTLAGDENIISAMENVIISGGIVADADDASSNGNTIIALQDVTLGATDEISIGGDDNSVKANEGSITLAGDIDGDRNRLDAGTFIDAQGITGDNNTLDAGTTITTADIEGNENILTAGESITTGNITGDSNALDAGTTISTGDISGHENTLTAVESIATGDIAGDSNVLNAGTTIETGDITGNSNDLDAVESITAGDITGDMNTLDAGTSITAGVIDGDENKLTGGTSVTVDAVIGDTNELVAKDGDLTIGGVVQGEENTLSSENANVIIEGDLIGEGNPNSVTAAGTVEIWGNLGGIGTNVVAYAQGLSQDDVAIQVGSFNAQGTNLTIATTSDDVYGYASGNGSIVIGSMGAVEGEVDASLVNKIISNNSYVTIGEYNGFNAYTTITAAKDVIVGLDTTMYGTGVTGTEQSAANQTITGKNFVLRDTVGHLTLTDSIVNVTDSITGTALTLTTTVSGMGAPEFASSASRVTLQSLTIGGNASLTANWVVLENLTIDGTYATLAATNLTATGTLTLKNGAVFDIQRVNVKALVVEDSILNTATLTGIENLTLTRSTGIISGGVAMTGNVTVNDKSSLQTAFVDIDGELNVTKNSNAVVTGNIAADAGIKADDHSSISGLNITTNGANLIASNESTITGQDIEAGTITAENDSTIKSTGKITGSSLTVTGSEVEAAKSIALTGALDATDGSTVKGNLTGVTNATVKDSTVNGSIGMGGELTATDATITGKVTGATSATITGEDADTTVADIEFAITGGSLTVTDAVVGNVTNATTATITGTDKVTAVGNIAMNGALNASNATIGNVSGATSVSLNKVESGSIAMRTPTTRVVDPDSRDAEILNGSTVNGDITDANDVTITSSTVTGMVAMDGKLSMTNGTIAGGLAEGTTVTEADLSGATLGSGITSTGDVTINDASSVSGAVSGTTVTIEGKSIVSGNVEATEGNATITDSSVGSVDAEGDVIASGATINGTVDGANVELSNNTTAGDVTATGTLDENGELVGGTATITDSIVGSVDAEGDVTASGATINGTVDGANVSLSNNTTAGDVTATGTATITGSTAGIVQADGDVTLESAETDAVTSTTGNVTATGSTIDGAVSGANVSLSNNTTAGDVTATGTLDENGELVGGTATITDSIVGSVDAEGDVTASGATINGTVDGANVSLSNNTTAGDVTATGTATITGSTAGIVQADGDVTLESAETDAVTSTTGNVTATGSTIDGAVSGANVSLSNNTTAGDVTATGTLDENGELVGGTATITDSIVGSVDAEGDVTASGATINGTVDGANVSLSNNTTAGDVTATGTATITNSITGSVDAEGDVTASGSTINGTVDGANVSLSNNTTAGDVTATGTLDENGELVGGTVSITNSAAGSVTANSDVTLEGAETNTVTSTTGNVTATGSTIVGDVMAEGIADLTDGEVSGNVMADTVTTNGTAIGGNVTADTAATITGGEAGSVSVGVSTDTEGNTVIAEGGIAAISGATINGDVTADTVTATNGAEISGSVTADTMATIKGSTVGANVTVNGEDGKAIITGSTVSGDVTADYVTTENATIEGKLTINKGAGFVGGTVTEDVIIEDKNEDGKADGDISGNGTVFDGNISADDVTLIGGSADSVIATGKADLTNTVVGTLDEDGNVVPGTVQGSDVDITGGTAGAVTATTGDATIDGGATVGNVTAEEGTATINGATADSVTGSIVNLTDATINGDGDADTADVKADGTATITGTTIGGDVEAGTVDMTGGSAEDVTATTGSVTMDGTSADSVTAAGKADLDDATITGTVQGSDVDITGGTAGAVTATTGNATIDGGATVGNVTAEEGTATINGATADSVTGSIVNLTDATINGDGDADTADVKADGTATITGTTIGGDVEAGTVDMTGGSAEDVTATTGSVTMNGTSADSVTAAGKADLDDATITGTVQGSDVDITGGTAGAVTATTGNATIDGGATVGNVTAEEGTATINGATADSVTGSIVNLTDATINGDGDADTADVKADGTATITGTTIGGDVEAGTVDMTGGSAEDVTATTGTVTMDGTSADSVTAAGKADLDDATITGTVQGSDVDITGGTAGAVTATTGNATIDGGATVGNVTAEAGTATIEGATADSVTGSIVNLTDATINGDGDADTVDVKADGTATITGTTIGGDVEAGTVDMTGGSAEDVTATTGNATIDGGATVGNVTAEEGTATINGATADSVTGSIVNLTDATIKGDGDADTADVKADGTATITGTTIGGDVEAGTVDMTGGSAEDVTATTGSVTMNGTSADSVTAAGKADLTNTVVGTLDEDGNVVPGTVQGSEVDITGGAAGAVTATTGDATIDGGATVGNVTAEEGTATINGATADSVTGSIVNLTDATINGDGDADTADVKATGTATITGGSVTGDVEAKDVVLTDAAVSGSVTAEDSATLTGGTVGADVTVTGEDGKATITNAVVTGDVTADSVETQGADIKGTLTITGEGESTFTGSTVTNDITSEGDIVADGTNFEGSVSGDDVTITDGTAGDVTAKGTASITEATVGDVTGDDVNVTKGSTGSITATGDVTLENATTGDITAKEGTVKADSTTDMGNVKAGAADVNGATADSLTTGDLTVGDEGFTADDSIAADGKIDIDGDTAAGGSITLDGAEGSSIEGADVTAGDKVTLDGTIDATDTTITGANGVEVSGTLNAGEGVALDGAVAGKGTINKTGGDTLELDGDTDMTGGKVNVKDSALAAGDGAKLGSVTLSGSEMTVAGDEVGSVTIDSLTTDKDSTLKLDVELAGDDTKGDSLGGNGKLDLNGAVVELNTVGDEASVADQTRQTIISGDIVSGANEDVVHGMDTLNAHIENTSEGVELVLSKNYKGAEGKTQNQSSTADALASIEAKSVAGTELGDVLDALAHTRSEAAAKAALDSLSGSGLAGLQKAITDEAKEHMQTLRSTMKALNADVQRRYDENSQRIEGVQSTAISASATGGTSTMKSTENCGEYTRNSFGAMVGMAHALYNGWTFGASFAFSYADAECGDVTMDGQFIYVDLAMMHKGQRLTQTGTIGAAFINFDTERDVFVNAAGHSFSGKAEGSTSAVAINMSYEMAYDLLKSEDGHRLGTVVLAEATFAQIDGMDEDGMGNAGVRAEFDDVASLTLGVGARYSYEFGPKNNPGYFNLDAMVVAEAGDNTPKVNNMFIGGGQTYELVGPDAGEIGLRLNAGLLLPVGEQTGVFMNATSEFRSEQTNVGGSVGIKYSF